MVFLFIPPFAPVAFGEEGSGSNPNGFMDEVNGFDGSVNISQTITVPPGRNGLQPELSLSYNSNARDVDNIYGHGWSLNIPYIVRENKLGTNNLYSTDHYRSSLDGELVGTGGGEYRPRTETGAARVYTKSGNVWTVTDKLGLSHTFGATAASRQDNPNNSTEVFKWMVSETEDSNGNTITYSYYKSNGAIYPDEISYNQNNFYSVEFDRTSQGAASTSYAGFFVKADEKIDTITVKADGSTVRAYNLTYTDRRITSIAETGYSDSGSVTLPARNFTYEYTTASSSWSFDDSWNTTGLTVEDNLAPGTRFADINGDGLPDAVVSMYDNNWGTPHVRYVAVNTGSGFENSTSFSVPEGEDFAFWNNGVSGGGHLVDVNGDGLADLVESDFSDDEFKFYINDGDSWEYESTWDTPANYDVKEGYRFIDVNGDGLPDRVLSHYEGSFQFSVCLNEGDGFSSSCSSYVIPNLHPQDDHDFAFSYDDGTYTFPWTGGIADINGDGLADIYVHDAAGTDHIDVHLNNGSGWEEDPDPTWNVNIHFDFKHGIRFFDINGDGLNDVVQAVYDNTFGTEFQTSIRINNGAGFDSAGEFTIPDHGRFAFWNNDGEDADTGSVADVDGDGIADFIDIGANNDFEVWFGGFARKAEISEVENSFGGTTAYEYVGAGMSDSSNQQHIPVPVVAKVVRNNGFGSVGTSTYTYKHGDYWYASSTDRRFAGFGEVTETTDAGNQKITKFHQANGTSSDELDDSVYAFMGLPYEVTVKDDLGNTYRTDRFGYTTGSGTSTSIYRSSDLTRHFEGGSIPADTAVSYTYDSNGNVLTKTEHGLVSGNADGTFTDTGSDDRETTYTYASQLPGYVTSEVLEDDGGTKVRESRYLYDNLTFGNVGDGNLTTREDWVSGSTYVDTEWEYNTYGQPTKMIDPRDHETTYGYDSESLFVTTETNAEGHVTTRSYDYSSGQVATTTDPNGNVSAVMFDGLDRPLEEWITDNSSSTLVLRTEYEYTDTAGAVAVKKTDHLDGTTEGQVDAYSYFDGFGRVIQERTEGEEAFVVRDFAYDYNGRLTEESLPYFDSGFARTTATTNDDLITTYQYDGLDRVVSAETAVGATVTVFNPLSETVNDSLDNDKTYEYDAFGRLVEVVEEEGSSSFTTTYSYDPANNLTTIADASGNVRGIEYDGLSRRTKLEDLHASGDSTYGSTTFAYDPAGNVISRTNADGTVVSFTYDDLGRVLTENDTTESGVEVAYTYDTCGNGEGRLCSAVTDAASSSFTYTANGLPATETKVIDGNTYVTTREYDRLGNETYITYPDNSAVRMTYNTRGLLETIEQGEAGLAWNDIITDLDYSPHGLISHQIFGNGASTTRFYDPEELYRLKAIATQATTTYGTGGAGAEHALIEAELSGLLAETVTEEVLEAEPIEVPAAEEVVEETEPIAEVTAATEEASSTEPVEVVEVAAAPASEPVETQVVKTKPVKKDVATTSFAFPEKPKVKKRSGGIFAELTGKSFVKQADIKAAHALEKVKPQKTTTKEHNVTIEITDTNVIEGGIEIFARAFDHNGQIGFGTDGSVDVERFRIFNPPVLVPDDDGEVERLGGFNEEKGEYEIARFRYDPEAAIIDVLDQTIEVKHERFSDRNIQPGKIGNTTDIYYPSFDGSVGSKHANSYSSMRSGSNLAADDSYNFIGVNIGVGVYRAPNWAAFRWFSDRGFVNFDTSPLPDDAVIDTATLQFYPMTVQNVAETGNDTIIVTEATPASDTSLSTGDWDEVGAGTNPTEFITPVDIGTLSTTGYEGFTLNGTGRSHIDRTGITNFGLRGGDESSGVEPSFSANSGNRVLFYASDETGTTKDPHLVVEHHQPAGNLVAIGGNVQNLSYRYDTVGNIVEVVDRSDTISAATTSYGYDDLYRLTSASTDQASTSGYSRTFSYDALGNILNKSDQGSYSYAGNIGGNFANPHAVTTIGSLNYTYDQNGNVTAISDGSTFTWDYNHRLTESTSGSTTIEYGYDHTGQRVFKKVTEFGTGGAGAEHSLIEAELSGLMTASTSSEPVEEITEEEIVAEPAVEVTNEEVMAETVDEEVTEASIEMSVVTEEEPAVALEGAGSEVVETTKAVSTAPVAITEPISDLSASSTDQRVITKPKLKPAKGKIFSDLKNKDLRQRADIKAQYALENVSKKRSVLRPDLTIEITDTNIIDGGIEVFARAWDEDGQVGFGTDGSVDVERFRIFNPPVLVADERGDIERLAGVDEAKGEYEVTRFRYDPEAAIHQVLDQTIGVKQERFDEKNIKPGKIGNTTDIYYPSFDGAVASKHQNSYSTMLTGTSMSVDTSAHFLGVNIGVGVRKAPSWATYKWYADRGFINFDTSPLPDTAVIDSATLQLYPIDVENDLETGNDDLIITEATPASDTGLTTADWDEAGATTNPTEFITPVDIGSLSTAGYEAFALNSAGIAHIDETGITNFGLRGGDDTSGVEPAFGANDGNRVLFYTSDETGTTKDPYLVVEHHTPSGNTVPTGTTTLATSTNDAVHYASSLFEMENNSTTKHVYAGDMLVATIEGSGASAETYYNHLDHLNSSAVVTNSAGHVDQILAYYPFGSDRIDQQYGSQNQTKRFTGHDYDEESDLTYMKARYYSGETGRFKSQDPVALALGDQVALEEMVRGSIDWFLERPQMMNSYSYAVNNPIILVDPEGEAAITSALLLASSVYGFVELMISVKEAERAYFTYPDAYSDGDRLAIDVELTTNLATMGMTRLMTDTASLVFDATMEADEFVAYGLEQTDMTLRNETTAAFGESPKSLSGSSEQKANIVDDNQH